MTKREAILEAALSLMTTNGIHATPMSAIAKEAGTGMGTIYNYFPNKDALINELYVTIKNKEKNLFVAFNDQEPLRTQFEAYYIQSVQFFTDNPLYFNLIEQLQASPIITAESREIGYEAISFVMELIENGKKKRVIKDIEARELIQFVGGTIISYLRLLFQTSRKEKPSLSNHLKMVWDAIKE
ncbi:MAG: TetR/AcrR family transcriptional regulator [Bacteroidota bacterium]